MNKKDDHEVKDNPLATTMLLRDMPRQPMRLSREDRIKVVEQALTLLEQSYIHLLQKETMYAVNPVQRLRLLKHRIEQTSQDQLPDEMLFHNEMLEIFNLVRDLHTNYLLPAPYKDQVAYLPFLLEEYFENNQSHFIVTWIKPGTQCDPNFTREVEVLYWNGVPIKREIELNAARQAGSNLYARYQRGLATLTIRPLIQMLPPDEEWVRLRYLDLNKKEREVEFKWLVYMQEPDKSAEHEAKKTGESLAFGFDIQGSRTQETRKDLMTKYGLIPTTLDTIFRARPQKTSSGVFGYIRIFTFMHPKADDFIAEFQHLVKSLPQNGLIIDVRGNGGGNILACEGLLQLFAKSAIEPVRFQFVNSPLTLALCQRYDDLRIWERSIALSFETGEAQSLSYPISSKESCNSIGRVYKGPVVLITDPLCYSATDIFAASFKDHEIGMIMGTSGNTGAGGANVWTHSDLCALVNRLSSTSPARSLFSPLPAGIEMRVAIRRCLRVRDNAGIPVEDLGVTPHDIHWMTKDDLLHDNVDMLEQAGRLLTQSNVRT
jgi:hypothetical protein